MNPKIRAELGPPQAVLLEQRGGGFLLPAPVGCLLKGHQKQSSSLVHPKFVNQECLWKGSVCRGEEGAGMPWEKAVLTSLILRKKEARFPQLGVQSSRDICGVDYVSLAHAL